MAALTFLQFGFLNISIFPRTRLLLQYFLINTTCPKMVVHHADGLHERVNDGRPNEFEAHLLQVFADPFRS